MNNQTYNKRKMTVVFVGTILIMSDLLIRLAYLMIEEVTYYQEKATD